ncbi:anti-sigma factor domain-containing protein [Microbacterium sp. NPDC056044]|uniref:anti-sigma factor n=1 Tax=Microbacterium sp. NPDC056044 TaxID=3345690 RepID=UPI0035D7FDA5
MSHLDPERLALAAVGDALTDAEQQHLATCDACSLELAELEHTVAVGRSTVTLGELETPPERVWDRIRDEVRAQPEAAASGIPVDVAVASPPAVAENRPDRRPARRRGWMLFALAASIAAVLAVAGVWNLVRTTQPVEIASATLDAFPDHPGAVGTAQVTELSDGERTLTVSLDDFDESGGFREVWLITADASDLVSLGELDGKKGTFVVPADVDLRDYVLVDVSQEPLDGNPAHSGDSIVRGQLEFG